METEILFCLPNAYRLNFEIFRRRFLKIVNGRDPLLYFVIGKVVFFERWVEGGSLADFTI